MPPKKPPFSPSTVTKSSAQPPARSKATAPLPARGKQQADKQWQRTKRYGWDSR